MNRTDHNGALRIEDEGRQVELVGWVSKREISGDELHRSA